MFMKMDGLRDGTDSLSTGEVLAQGYMAAPTEMDMAMLNVSAGYSLTDDFFLGLMAMYRDNSMDMAFNPMMQGMTGRSGFSMESSGFGDTMLMSKYRLYADDPMIPTGQVSLFLGLSLPTGSIDEKNDKHPLPIRQREQLPYSMQLGSGTFDPILGLLYQASSSPWWWGLDLRYTGRWYDNRRDYRLGDEVAFDAYGMYQLRYDLVLQLQLNLFYQGKIRGEMDSAASGESGHMMPGNPLSPYMSPLWDPAHYGGTQLFSTVGLQWQPRPFHVLDLAVGLPIYRDLNGPQLETDYRVMLTWYWELPTSWSTRYPENRKRKKSRLGF
jgi:hypothetical protein